MAVGCGDNSVLASTPPPPPVVAGAGAAWAAAADGGAADLGDAGCEVPVFGFDALPPTPPPVSRLEELFHVLGSVRFLVPLPLALVGVTDLRVVGIRDADFAPEPVPEVLSGGAGDERCGVAVAEAGRPKLERPPPGDGGSDAGPFDEAVPGLAVTGRDFGAGIRDLVGEAWALPPLAPPPSITLS